VVEREIDGTKVEGVALDIGKCEENACNNLERCIIRLTN